jgi:flagellar operon protein
MSGPILYPNVTSLPGQGGIKSGDQIEKKKPGSGPSDFDKVFDRTINPGTSSEQSKETSDAPSNLKATSDLSQTRSPLKFSAHATQRLKERKIELDPATMAKVNDAIDKADSKGVQDTLILTKDAALIVNVKNRTVVTAMDRGSLTGNVFTNIDGAVLV